MPSSYSFTQFHIRCGGVRSRFWWKVLSRRLYFSDFNVLLSKCYNVASAIEMEAVIHLHTISGALDPFSASK